VGKCARLGEGANWVFHLMTHMYASTAFALRSNANFLGQRSKNFVKHLKKIKELRKIHQHQRREDMAVINFSIKKAAQQIHRCDNEYFIPKTMRQEI
jgi:predicted MarR family transcription regulator